MNELRINTVENGLVLTVEARGRLTRFTSHAAASSEPEGTQGGWHLSGKVPATFSGDSLAAELADADLGNGRDAV